LQKCEGFFDPGLTKSTAHANVPLRLRRALQSRVEAPLFNRLHFRDKAVSLYITNPAIEIIIAITMHTHTFV